MGTINTWHLTETDLANEYDRAKDIIVEKLISDGLLEEDAGELWAAAHTFAVKQPNLISRWISRVFEDDGDRYRMFLLTIEQRKDD